MEQLQQLRVYHLQTHKVVSINKEDRMPVIESILVKLTSILSLKKYSLFLKQEAIIKGNPPKVIKVLIDGKDAGNEEREKAQAIVDEIVKPQTKQLSYKEKFEEQEKRGIELEKRLETLEGSQVPQGKIIDLSNEADNLGEQLEATKGYQAHATDPIREQLEAKAEELNITFRSNLGNEKLLLKIQDIEPEYEI